MFHCLVVAGALAAFFAAPPDHPPTAITHARLVDGTGAPARTGCTVLIRGERFAAVGPGVAVPADAKVIDGKGMTLVPGMFDTHGHCFTDDGTEQYEAYPLLFLAAGVTTTFSPGEKDPAAAYALRERLARNEQTGARLMTVGPYFEKGQGELEWLRGYRDQKEALAWLAENGPKMDGMKLLERVDESDAAALIAEAHRLGIRVTGHLGTLTARRAIELGIDRLEHGLFAMSDFSPWDIRGMEAWSEKCRTIGALDLDSAPVQELIDLIVSKRVALSATTVSFAQWTHGFAPLAPDWDRYLAPEIRQREKARARRMGSLPDAQAGAFAAAVRNQLAFLLRVHQRGGIVTTGTDPGNRQLIPGYSVHREMQLLVDGGFTPLDALRAATLHAATALGVERDLGSVEAGKLADLVLVEGNPDEDIAAIGNTRRVWKAGNEFDPVKLRDDAEGKIR